MPDCRLGRTVCTGQQSDHLLQLMVNEQDAIRTHKMSQVRGDLFGATLRIFGPSSHHSAATLPFKLGIAKASYMPVKLGLICRQVRKNMQKHWALRPRRIPRRSSRYCESLHSSTRKSLRGTKNKTAQTSSEAKYVSFTYPPVWGLRGLLALLVLEKGTSSGCFDRNHGFLEVNLIKVRNFGLDGILLCLNLEDLPTIINQLLKGLWTTLHCSSKTVEMHHLHFHLYKEWNHLRKKSISSASTGDFQKRCSSCSLGQLQ